MAYCVIAASSSHGATLLAGWTFQTSVPATAGPHAAETGFYAGSSYASGNTNGTWSNPAGWGSTESFSSNDWNVDEYFQFVVSTLGYSKITVSWQQTGSSTGPANFQLAYSTDGTSFAGLGIYNVTSDSWNATSTPAASEKFFDLSGITALDNQSTVFFRLINTSTVAISSSNPVAAGGTSRVDNFSVNSVPEPSAALIGGLGLLGLLRRRR